MFVTCDPVILSPAALVNMIAAASHTQLPVQCLPSQYAVKFLISVYDILAVLIESGAVGNVEVE